MEKYDYYEVIKDDIRNYIEENEKYIKEEELADMDSLREYLQDEMFVSDSVTGDASGSYFFNTWKAEEAICHNLDLLADACAEFGSIDVLKDGAESCDVMIRRYLLGECLCAVLEEDEEELQGLLATDGED